MSQPKHLWYKKDAAKNLKKAMLKNGKTKWAAQ